MNSIMTRLFTGTVFITAVIVVSPFAAPVALAGETKQPPKTTTTQNPAGGQMSGTEQVGNNSGRNTDTKPKNPATSKPQGK